MQNKFSGIGKDIMIPQIEMHMTGKEACSIAGYHVEKGKIHCDLLQKSH